jgi:ribose 5-phosphate isomerase B
MKIFIGADHRGFALKEKIKNWMEEGGYDVQDMGNFQYDKDDDYTLYAQKVAVMVADNRASRGVLLCGSGVGVNVVANKFDGVRASLGKSAKQVKAGRSDDDMNALVIAADYTSENETKKMIDTFLKTEFASKERHKRRLEEIKRIEANN